MSDPSERTNKEDTKRTQEHSVADKSPEQRNSEIAQSRRELSTDGSAYLKAANRILSETESRINRLEGKLLAGDEKFKFLEEKLLASEKRFKSLDEKLSACDEKLKALEARTEKRWVDIFPNYVMVLLTLGIAVFTGVLMWYLSKGPTDKTLTGTEEVINNGFKTFNDFLSMYLSIAKDRTTEGTTVLVGSLTQVQKSLEELPQCSSNE